MYFYESFTVYIQYISRSKSVAEMIPVAILFSEVHLLPMSVAILESGLEILSYPI